MSSEVLVMGGFLVLVTTMLAIDLGLFHKKDHVVSVKEALGWTGVWVSMALLFCLFIFFKAEWIHGVTTFEQIAELNARHGHRLTLDAAAGFETALGAYRKAMSLEFLTGYLIEEALSVDNIFVMIMILMSFKVDPKYYHKILFWGIIGAVVLRFAFIFSIGALVQKFAWILWIFGGILIFSGMKMLFSKEHEEEEDMRKGKFVRWLSKRLRMTRSDHGGKFFTRLRIRGRHLLYVTPLFMVLLVIEGSDVVFAVDSIPAIFSVTLDPYIVFFSNIFAILGLRSLFFVLSGVMNKFAYLKTGLAVLLTFIGAKMLLHGIFHISISTPVSLLTVVGILAVSIGASLLFPPKAKEAAV
jgi:tellurite resistance protein TerC